MPVNLPYPLQFDPSQMKNPYTKWAGVPLPDEMASIGPSGEFGGTAPTNALGQPIQSYTDAASAAAQQYQQQMADYQKAMTAYNAGQGTQVNNTGGSAASANYSNLGQWGPAVSELENNYLKTPAGAAAANNPNAAMIQFLQSQNQGIQSSPQGATGGFGSGNSGPLSGAQREQIVNNAMQIQQLQRMGAAQPARPAPPQAPAQPNMTQAYLAALQNPGHVTSPGATVAEAPAPSQQSNVLQNFVANWKPGTNVAGNYNNQSMIDAMRGNV